MALLKKLGTVYLFNSGAISRLPTGGWVSMRKDPAGSRLPGASSPTTSYSRSGMLSPLATPPRRALHTGRRSVLRCSPIFCFYNGLHTGTELRSKSKQKSSSDESKSVLMEIARKRDEPKQVTVATKVVQAGKDMTYLLVILGGFALTGFLFWSVGSEFFSSNSPSAIFTQALKRIKNDPRVVEMLGEPITGHGEHSGRNRRRHIPHQEYIYEGQTYMRVKFYVDGSKRKATATVDLKKNDRGKYECRFLIVELQGASKATVVVEDNR